MKNIILFALIVLMIVGCDYKNKDGSYNTRNIRLETIVIDSCEYIGGVYKFAHKGNCKYCKERRQKELKELVKQLKEE